MSELTSPVSPVSTSNIGTGVGTNKQNALDAAVPDPTNVLLARLENWKQAVGLLQSYFEAHLVVQKNVTTGLEKARATVADAPKFDYSPTTATSEEGQAPAIGIAESFEEIRTKTEILINKSVEVEAQFKQAVFPQLETLKGDIEKHLKGLKGPGLKTQKDVEKARSLTQKAIETLGQYVSSYNGTAAVTKPDPNSDPYVLKRQALASISDQVIKENAQADSIISVQNNFQTLERHIVQVLQQAVYLVHQTLGGYATTQAETYQSISDKFSAILPDHEWELFSEKNKDVLIPENSEKRDVNNITFPNENHESTLPVIEGILQRKGTVLKSKYHSGYYVVTPSRFLHQFKSQDYIQDPTPELSLYLPKCTLGPAATQSSGKYKFTISGKDKNSLITKKHSFVFKTSTYQELLQWHDALQKLSGISATNTAVSTDDVLSDDAEPDVDVDSSDELEAASPATTGIDSRIESASASGTSPVQVTTTTTVEKTIASTDAVLDEPVVSEELQDTAKRLEETRI